MPDQWSRLAANSFLYTFILPIKAACQITTENRKYKQISNENGQL